MRVLVTGAAGQLGVEVARQLRAAAHQVVGMDRRPGPEVNHVGDIANRLQVQVAMVNTDAVIHTASLHAPHVASTSKAAFVRTNVLGTRHLLELAAQAGVCRFVYTSTTSVYGAAMEPADAAVWVTEGLVPRPRDIYDVTKLAAEALCRQAARETATRVVCLRTSRFFPEPPERMTIYRLYRGGDVRDIARAHVLGLVVEHPAFGLYNVSARSPFRKGDLAELLHAAQRVIGRYYPDAPRVFAERGWHLPNRIDRVYVIAAAEQALGFRPRYNFDALLR